MQVAEHDTAPDREHRVYWWKEALIVARLLPVYSWTRNLFGSNKIAADGIPDQAFTNAVRVIRVETALNLFHEQTVQAWFLPYKWFIQFWNTWYGTPHFIVTLGVFVLLFVKRRDVFPQWRNTLAAMTALAIIGFALFPLMPPRLLDEPCPAERSDELRRGLHRHVGAARGRLGFVDTLAEYGGPWSFDSDTMASISNQYAAMPSMHIGWSTWCAVAVWPLLQRRWTKALVLLYPLATLFCIIVTANHFWLDGVGGLLAFGVGAVIGWGLHRWNQDRLDRRHSAMSPTEAQPPYPELTMSQMRLNPLNGRWVTIVPDRQRRPNDFAPRDRTIELDTDRPCPFCPGNEEETPPAIETTEADGTWSMRVVPNRYPAFDGDDLVRRPQPRPGPRQGRGQRHPRGLRVHARPRRRSPPARRRPRRRVHARAATPAASNTPRCRTSATRR